MTQQDLTNQGKNTPRGAIIQFRDRVLTKSVKYLIKLLTSLFRILWAF